MNKNPEVWFRFFSWFMVVERFFCYTEVRETPNFVPTLDFLRPGQSEGPLKMKETELYSQMTG